MLVGGMALVAMGSRRVTRDFDLVVADPGERLEALDPLYGRGLLGGHLKPGHLWTGQTRPFPAPETVEFYCAVAS